MREGRQERREHYNYKEHRERRGKRNEEADKRQPSRAQTFRRGRALAFLDKLNLRRASLQRQMEQPEFESIKTIISGELKATDAIIQEFIHTFELRESLTKNEQETGGNDLPNDDNPPGEQHEEA